MKILSRIEELILLTVWRLQGDAYGINIRNHIIEKTGTNWSIGAIYVPLDRLVKWEFLKTSQSDSTPERGGRSKRYYSVTKEGSKALNELKKVQETMWSGLSDASFGTSIE